MRALEGLKNKLWRTVFKGETSRDIEEDELDKYRDNDSYRRLSQRLVNGGENFLESGMKSTSLKWGELVDICKFYSEVAGVEYDTTSMMAIASVQYVDLKEEAAKSLIDSMISIEDDGLLGHEGYDLEVDLTKIYKERQNILVNRPGRLGLHYADTSKRSRFIFKLLNHQGMDEGKGFMKELYEEVGIPVTSNIED